MKENEPEDRTRMGRENIYLSTPISPELVVSGIYIYVRSESRQITSQLADRSHYQIETV